MRTLTTKADLESCLRAETLIPVNATKLDTYVDVSYECGCGSYHDVAGPECLNMMSAKTVKVLLRCEKNYYTFIKIKGLFRIKCESIWSFHADLIEVDEPSEPYRFEINSSSWLDFPTKQNAQVMMIGRRMGSIKH